MTDRDSHSLSPARQIARESSEREIARFIVSDYRKTRWWLRALAVVLVVGAVTCAVDFELTYALALGVGGVGLGVCWWQMRRCVDQAQRTIDRARG